MPCPNCKSKITPKFLRREWTGKYSGYICIKLFEKCTCIPRKRTCCFAFAKPEMKDRYQCIKCQHKFFAG